MNDQFEELEEWALYGFHYRATRSQANAIGLEFAKSPQANRHRKITKMLDCIVIRNIADADAMKRMQELVREEVLADVDLSEFVCDLLRRHGVQGAPQEKVSIPDGL